MIDKKVMHELLSATQGGKVLGDGPNIQYQEVPGPGGKNKVHMPFTVAASMSNLAVDQIALEVLKRINEVVVPYIAMKVTEGLIVVLKDAGIIKEDPLSEKDNKA